MRTVRKLVLGETWALPLGIAIAVGAAAVLRHTEWFREAGGWLLFAALVIVLVVAVLRPSRR